ncbi:hypothetical protein [Rubellimicrobium roseum]|uniref:Helix-turn-helix domain-containing protein n=1 Tax=Rubellimicrobium roseum TaxID=687525 RepID=A0A5C4N5T6_9RHOB|nr:hypothetical protein [Rubellimicrobium roseum]TNC60301.1 hypothetical protein FHG71_22150 [Rubellimicrobium roseum]
MKTHTYEDPASSGFRKIGLFTAKPRYRIGSERVGRCEHKVALALKPSVLANLVLTARLTDRLSRKVGSRNGDLGHVALEAFDWLRKEMKGGAGFVAHAFTYIRKAITRSRSAVVEGIHRLVDQGWLRKVRRKDENGQAINAYGFSLPRSAYALASRLFGKVDVPEDVARDFDAMCQRFPRWRVEWEDFLRHMKDVWKAEGHPVSEGQGGQTDVLDRHDDMRDLPVSPAVPPRSDEQNRFHVLMDMILSRLGSESAQRSQA